MPDPREKPQPPETPPADVQGGDVDVSTDVELPSDRGGMLSEGTPDSEPAGREP